MMALHWHILGYGAKHACKDTAKIPQRSGKRHLEVVENNVDDVDKLHLLFARNNLFSNNITSHMNLIDQKENRKYLSLS